jgi:hypothetical protein
MPMGPIVRPKAQGTSITYRNVVRILKQRIFLILLSGFRFQSHTIRTYLWARYGGLRRHGAGDVESPLPKHYGVHNPIVQVDLLRRGG